MIAIPSSSKIPVAIAAGVIATLFVGGIGYYLGARTATPTPPVHVLSPFDQSVVNNLVQEANRRVAEKKAKEAAGQ
jgi:hypothetical protein